MHSQRRRRVHRHTGHTAARDSDIVAVTAARNPTRANDRQRGRAPTALSTTTPATAHCPHTHCHTHACRTHVGFPRHSTRAHLRWGRGRGTHSGSEGRITFTITDASRENTGSQGADAAPPLHQRRERQLPACGSARERKGQRRPAPWVTHSTTTAARTKQIGGLGGGPGFSQYPARYPKSLGDSHPHAHTHEHTADIPHAPSSHTLPSQVAKRPKPRKLN